MSKWRMEVMCDNCPFAKGGNGKFLHDHLNPNFLYGEILRNLQEGGYFTCHKTTVETGDGSNLVCAGAMQWQEDHQVACQYTQVMERLELMSKKGIKV